MPGPSAFTCPPLRTRRFLLEPLAERYATDILELRADEEVSRYLDRPLMQRPEEALSFVREIMEGMAAGDYLYWVIVEQEQSNVLGTICLWQFNAERSQADLGYELKPAAQGKGAMTEAMWRVVEYARDSLGLQRLYACTHPDNQPSLRLLAKANFTHERKLGPTLTLYLKHLQGLPAYLQRIGMMPSARPSLPELQRAHLHHIPFENLDIHFGRSISIRQPDIFRKLVHHRRGGFCYEQNGLFQWVLAALGYEAKLVQAQVYSTKKGEYGPPFDHMAIWVETESGPYLADVGFGNAPLVPLPIRHGAEAEGTAGTYRMEALGDGWHKVSHQTEEGWMPDYIFDSQARRPAEYEPMALYHQSSQDSPFPKQPLISLPEPAGGRVTISGRELKISKGGQQHTYRIESDEEYEKLLRQHFGVELQGVSTASRIWRGSAS